MEFAAKNIALALRKAKGDNTYDSLYGLISSFQI